MHSPRALSVVVPVHNKVSVLSETFQALECQDGPRDEFEVIAVDDGSDDGSHTFLAGRQWSLDFRLLGGPNAGAGAARNLGAAAAKGRILLFLDADIIPSPSVVEAHVNAHGERDRVVVVGRVRPWVSAGRASSHSPYAQSFDLGPHERSISSGFGITQNLSIKARHFEDIGGFDPALRRGQDIDFAHRASQLGLELRYEPRAVAYHNHELTLDQLFAKTQRDHSYLVQLFRKHPDLMRELSYLEDKWPVLWGADRPGLVCRKLVRQILATAPLRFAMGHACRLVERTWSKPILLDFLVWKVLASYQLLGLRNGMEDCSWRLTTR